MALTLATELANYAAGIGTQGATLKVDSANKRVGVGTTNPQGPEGSLQVGTGITFFGNTGIISAIGGKFSGDFTVGGTLTYEDVQNVNSSGVGTFSGGINIVGGGLTVTGVSTFFSRVSIADSIVHTGDINTSLRFPAADTFTVETGGSEALRVDSSQRLLLGTTSAGHSTADDFTISNTSEDAGMTIRSGTSDKCQISFSDATTGAGEYAGQILYDHDGDFMRFRTNSEETVRITGIGSVGIGTDDPKMLLDISNSSGTGAQMMFHDSSTGYELGQGVRVGYNGSGAQMWNFESTYIRFATSNTERVRITGIGSFGIGSSNPEVDLVLRSSKASAAIAKNGLTVKTSGELHTSYDTLQIGAGGALLSYSVATATADTQLVHNAYRSSGGSFKYRYADTAARLRVNSPGRKWIFDSAASGSADADITFTEQLSIDVSGNLNAAGIATATQLFEGTTRVASTGKAIAMAMLFG